MIPLPCCWGTYQVELRFPAAAVIRSDSAALGWMVGFVGPGDAEPLLTHDSRRAHPIAIDATRESSTERGSCHWDDKLVPIGTELLGHDLARIERDE